jgi:hypothetical protein
MSAGGFDLGDIGDFAGDLLDTAIDVGSDLLDSGLEVLDAAGDWTGGFGDISSLGDLAGGAWETVSNFAGNADFFNANSFGSILNSGIQTVSDFAGSIVPSGGFSGITNSIAGAVSSVTAGLPSISSFVSGPSFSLPGLVNSTVASIAGPIAGFAVPSFSLPGLVNSTVASIAQPITGAISGAIRSVASPISSTIAGITQPVSGIFGSLTGPASTGFGIGTGYGVSTPGFGGSLTGLGFGNTTGYTTGTPSIFGGITNAIAGPVNALLSGISSPAQAQSLPVRGPNNASIDNDPFWANIPTIEITGVGVNLGNVITTDPNRQGAELGFDLEPSQSSARVVGYEAQFDELTQTYSVVETGTGQTIAAGLTEQEATLFAQEQTFADAGENFETEQNNEIENRSPQAVGYEAVLDPLTGKYNVVDVNSGQVIAGGLTEQEAILFAEDQSVIDGGSTPDDESGGPVLLNQDGVNDTAGQDQGLIQQARQQQTVSQQRTNKAQSGDWRVRLRLAPRSTYLYNAPDCGPVLWPLRITDGVIFPYTPKIDTAYKADYEAYPLTHSNYKGYFYKSSYVDGVNIVATFTAQDTAEANYLLAVIHFFRSATKMFYGQDAQRGAPPPLVYLSGLGDFQFKEHPCVISQFNYNLPSDVDYIRAQSANVNGTNLLQKRDRQTIAGNPLSYALQRLATVGLSKGAQDPRPAAPILGINDPTYVPTKMDIQLTLLPMQSRQQVSKQFSLQNFANGNLLKGGFW